jgi:uncharacterized protein (TIGR00106 family)
MALMHLTIIPLGTESPGLGEFVAEIQRALAKEKFAHEMTDMGTIIEGEMSELLALAARMSEIPFYKGAQRVLTEITLDDRRDKKVGLGYKTASVKARLADNG